MTDQPDFSPGEAGAQGSSVIVDLREYRNSKDPIPVTFHRRELDLILRIYGRMVGEGEWRDYAIDHNRDKAIFSIFKLSFAGIPLISGFVGKWAVFAAAWSGGIQWLVVVAVVISVVAAFFYIRVIVLMFFVEPRIMATNVVRPGWTTLAAVGVGLVATVAFGVFPGPLLALAQQAGEFIR